MSLKRNIAANYLSQIYVTLIGILMLPLYIQYMGAEVYGLVGFFTMLQAWFGLLDLGLTPTIGRETARYHGGVMPALVYLQLYRALSLIFICSAIFGGSGLFLLSDRIATHWLLAETLPLSDIVTAIKIMAISVALRWMCGLYRGVVTGSEKLVWLSGFNVLMATLRFITVLPVMWYFGFTAFVFFIYQLIVALIELSSLWLKSSRLLPPLESLDQTIGWSFKPVKPVLKFALTIAFTSAVWVLVTQTDKLVLSGVLPLTEYGYFTLAVLAASGIMVIGAPISTAIMPRMVKLHAEGKHAELLQVYRNATQLVSVIAGSAAITLAMCAEQLLFAWTGDKTLTAKAAPLLTLYAVGNGFLSVAAFSYYLQYAKGNLRYHLIGNVVMVIVLIPGIIFAATDYGAVGGGYVWLMTNGFFLLGWVAYVHHKIEPGLHWQWLSRDILAIIIPTLAVAYAITKFDFIFNGRMESFLYIAVFGSITFICAALSSKSVRQRFLSILI